MMKLFYAPGTCALAPMILAQWLDIPLQLERVDPRNPNESWLAVNPLGAVPALQLDNGQVTTQVDAILQYFCALEPGAGLGGGDDVHDQLSMHRWIAFLTGDFHPPFGVWFNPRRWTTDHSDTALAAVKQAAELRIERVGLLLEAQVQGGHVVLGRRTLLDAYAFSMVRWMKNLTRGFQPYPSLAAFMELLDQDAGVQKALQLERGD